MEYFKNAKELLERNGYYGKERKRRFRNRHKFLLGEKKTEKRFACSISKGAISELKVSADLMARGYYVYRALTCHAPCDLIAVRFKKLSKQWEVLRIEVKSVFGKYDSSKYDVLAVCIAGNVNYSGVKIRDYQS